MALTNSQYQAVMRIYGQRQLKDKKEQDERIREIYEKIPQIEALDDEITSLKAAAARRRLLGDESGALAALSESSGLKEQKLLYLKKNGYPADYMEMRYQCPDCRDTGYHDGKKCHCFKRMSIDILYEQYNVRGILERENFDNLTMKYYDRTRLDPKTGMTVYDYMKIVIQDCHDYVDRFGYEKGSILFTGSTGCGKTFLSNCIARELIRQGYSVVYLTASDLFDIFSEGRFGSRDDEDGKERVDGIMNCDLLIIDDLGTELINTFTSSSLFNCVNERLTKEKGTIISTNLPPNRLQDEFTERVASRILNQYKIYPLIGEDLRAVRRGFDL